MFQFSSVQFSRSVVRLFVTPWIAAHQASLFITISWSSLRLMSIESLMPSSHLILGCPLLLLPPIPPSIRVFSNESTLLMRWPKYWSKFTHIIMKGFRLWFVSACKVTELTWEKSMLLFSCVWEPMDCSRPGFPVLHHLPELAQSHVHWVSDASNHLVLCHPLLLLPLIFPSIRVFSNGLALLEKPAWLNGLCWQTNVSAF